MTERVAALGWAAEVTKNEDIGMPVLKIFQLPKVVLQTYN